VSAAITNALAFTHKFREVRGWSPRRIYLTPAELVDLLTEQRVLPTTRDLTLDGALVKRIQDRAVCNAIRNWDVMP
jgi:hypothetical protein